MIGFIKTTNYKEYPQDRLAQQSQLFVELTYLTIQISKCSCPSVGDERLLS